MADLNVRGGVNGQKVALVTHDDGCDAADGRESAKALNGSEVAGALGGICASAARAAARTLEPGLPFLVTSANTPSIVSAKRTPTAYLINGTPYQSALATAHFLAYQTRAAALGGDRGRSRVEVLGEEVLGAVGAGPEAGQRAGRPGRDDGLGRRT